MASGIGVKIRTERSQTYAFAQMYHNTIETFESCLSQMSTLSPHYVNEMMIIMTSFRYADQASCILTVGPECLTAHTVPNVHQNMFYIFEENRRIFVFGGPRNF